MFDNRKFGNTIKRLRKAEKISIFDLAVQIDVNYKNFGKYENDILAFPLDHIVKLCNYFGLSIGECLADNIDIERTYYLKHINSKLVGLGVNQYSHLRMVLDSYKSE